MSGQKQTWQKAVGAAVGLVGAGTTITGIGMGLSQLGQEAARAFPSTEAQAAGSTEDLPPLENTRVILIVGGGILVAAGIKLALDEPPTQEILSPEVPSGPLPEEIPDNVYQLPVQTNRQGTDPKVIAG